MKKFKIILNIVSIMISAMGFIGIIISCVAIFAFGVTQPTGVLFYFTVVPMYVAVHILIVCLIIQLAVVIYERVFNKQTL
ncbi:hypothetical protein ANABIO32_00900 [Rossellomorea marisflavi]|nr:hypothetical protein ANABIO32_00900 [Rossellomorea marisflavi]